MTTSFLGRLSVNAHSWQREPQLCETCGNPLFQVFIANSLHHVGDLVCSECEIKARAEQIKRLKSATIHNLYTKPGELLRNIHQRMMNEAAKLLAPPTPRPVTAPLPARDIVRSNTASRIGVVDIAHIPTNKLQYNPVTPLPEAREELFSDVPAIRESLLLWPEELEDNEATEIRVTKKQKRQTLQIPAIGAEVLLLELMRGPAHEQGTGEQAPIKEKNWMC